MLVSRIEPPQLIFAEITESESFGEVTSFPRKPGIYMILIELLSSIAVFHIETEYLNRVSCGVDKADGFLLIVVKVERRVEQSTVFTENSLGKCILQAVSSS